MKKGVSLVLFTALVSGFSIFINTFGVSGINPYVFTWSKNLLVAILLLLPIFALNEYKYISQLSKKQWCKLALIGLFGGSIPFLLFFKGLSMTQAATAAFIHKTMFIFVAILAMVFLREKLTKGVALAGAFLLVGNALLLKLTSFSFDIGALLVLAATLFWAVETIISKQILVEIPSRIVAFGRMGFGALFILIFLMFTGDVQGIVNLSIAQIGWIVLTSVLLFVYVFTWYAGLKLVDATLATCILLLGSVITTLLSLFSGSSLSLFQAAGLLLLISGVVVAIRSVYVLEKSKPFQLHTHNE